VEFLAEFVSELNRQADGEESAAVLVEGKRDRDALVGLGYTGRVLTRVSLHPQKGIALVGIRRVVILTDLDQEGRRLAGRYAALLAKRGVKVSLGERNRLLKASHGTFLHVENLARFAPAVLEIINLTSTA